MILKVRFAHVICAAIIFGFSACASAPDPTIVQITLASEINVNPDTTGRPSPIVIRLYELKSPAAFNNVDFFTLYEREQDSVGSDLVVREEMQLTPSEVRTFERQTMAETRFIGFAAAFRDLENARWRTIVPVPLNETTAVTIRLEGSNISIVSE